MNSEQLIDSSDEDEEIMYNSSDDAADLMLRSHDNESLDTFLGSTDCIVTTQLPKNFWSQAHRRECYNITQNHMPRFMWLINEQVTKKSILSITEFQYPPLTRHISKSGFYIDLDIKLSSKYVNFGEEFYRNVVEIIVKIFIKLVNIETDNITTHAAITIRPRVKKTTDDKNLSSDPYYRFGFHILIPGFQVLASEKKYIFKRIAENNKLIDYFIRHHKNILNPKKAVDIASAYVPALLLGSSKKGRLPYKLQYIFKIDIGRYHVESDIDSDYSDNDENEDKKAIQYEIESRVKLDEELINHKTFNPVYEFCLSQMPQHAKVKRYEFSVKEELLDEVIHLPQSYTDEIEDEDTNVIEARISELERLHPDIHYIKRILDLINHVKDGDPTRWFKVTVVLAQHHMDFKCLAEYWWRKSDKWDEWAHNFNCKWNEASKPGGWRENMKIGCLYKWASDDNPEQYKKVRETSAHTKIMSMLSKPYKAGRLGDADWAEIIYIFVKEKYVADYEPGSDIIVWYEFVTATDQHKLGEIWKWRKCRSPESLSKWISKILPEFCLPVLDRLKRHIKRKDITIEAIKYYIGIQKNFITSMQGLSWNKIKSGIISESQLWLMQRGFTEKLDQNPMTMGVGNGILVLDDNGNKEKLVQSKNTCCVSRYTRTNYPEQGFDPLDLKTKRLLLAFRSMFPDDEPDTHLFLMCFLASTLDARVKTGLFLLCVGEGRNGKSFIMEIMRCMLESSNNNGYCAKMRMTILTRAAKNAEAASPGIMQLVHARLAHYSESSQSATLLSDVMKELTGGETISGRHLHKGMQSFRPKCQHIVTTNNDLTIDSNDYGTWRRIKYLHLKMRFYDPDDDSGEYDIKNPYHRRGDRELIEKCAADPEYTSRLLSIMVFYHKILMKHFNGNIENIPCIHITAETREFKIRQDTINEFIRQRIIKIVNPEDAEQEKSKTSAKNPERTPKNDFDFNARDEVPIDEFEFEDGVLDSSRDEKEETHDTSEVHVVELRDIVEKYKAWYDTTIRPTKHYNREIRLSFITRSLLSNEKYLEKKNGEYLLKGWRALGTNESLSEGDVLFIDHLQDAEINECKDDKKDTSYYMPTFETVDQYYERICHEGSMNSKMNFPSRRLNHHDLSYSSPLMELSSDSIEHNTKPLALSGRPLHKSIKQKLVYHRSASRSTMHNDVFNTLNEIGHNL